MSWQIIELQELETLRRKLVLLLEKEHVSKQVNHKITDMSRKLNIKGFRPGQVPVKVVQRKFGAAIEGEVIQEEMEKSFGEVLKDKGLRVAFSHEMKPVQAVENGWQLEADFDIFPTIDLVDFQNIKVAMEKAQVSEQSINERQEQWRQYLGAFEVQSRSAKDEDMLLIKVQVSDSEGKVIEKSREKTIILGSEFVPVEVSKALSNQQAGYKCQVEVNEKKPATENTDQQQEQSNVLKTWDIELINVQMRVIPQWNEETIKKLGIEPATIEGVREQVKVQLEAEITNQLDNSIDEKLLEILTEQHSFELPKSLVDRELEALANQKSDQNPQPASQTDAQEDNTQKPSDLETASTRVKTSLIFGAIADKHDISPDIAWLQQTIESQANQYPDPEQFKKMMYSNENYMRQLEAKAMEVGVMKFVREKSSVEIKPAAPVDTTNANTSKVENSTAD